MSSAYGFKSQLKEVLSDAVSYFQDSGDPNAACVKAANEAGFNADQADRLVETFNTARVICHYKAAEEKTSSCSLADKDVVRRQLVPHAEERKSAEYDTADYGCYKQAEVDYVVPEVKVAAAELKEEPLSKEASDWLMIREFDTIKECIKSAEEEARAANAMADELAEKVAMTISRNVSIDAVHDRMARIVTAYALDDRYAPGVEKVAEFLPASSDPDTALLNKYAAMHIVDTSDLNDVMPAIKEAADFVAEASALIAYAEEMRKTAQQASNGKEDKGKSSIPSPKITPKFTAYVADTLRDQYGKELNRKIDKATDGINNVRRQLILQDLLITDKVLAQEDPSAVVAAFRSINQVSPDTTLNKEMLRSMLRSAVQSVALSPYDAKTLAEVDKNRRAAYDIDTTKSPSGKKGGNK